MQKRSIVCGRYARKIAAALTLVAVMSVAFSTGAQAAGTATNQQLHPHRTNVTFNCFLTIDARQAGNSITGIGDEYCNADAASIVFSSLELWACIPGRTATKSAQPLACTWFSEEMGPGCNFGYTKQNVKDLCPNAFGYQKSGLVAGTYYMAISSAATDLHGDIKDGSYNTPDFYIS